MWTPATRENDSRKGLRYQSDVTDDPTLGLQPATRLRVLQHLPGTR